MKRFIPLSFVLLAFAVVGCKTSTEVAEQTLAASPAHEEPGFMITANPNVGVGGIGAGEHPEGSSIFEQPGQVASAFPAGMAPEVRSPKLGYWNPPAMNYFAPGSEPTNP